MKKIKIFLKIIMSRELLKTTLVGMQTTVFPRKEPATNKKKYKITCTAKTSEPVHQCI